MSGDGTREPEVGDGLSAGLLLDSAVTAGLGVAGWIVGAACALTMAAALGRGLRERRAVGRRRG